MEKCDHYAVIGNPVAQSQSPFVHQQFAEQTGQSMEYRRILAPLDEFVGTVKNFQRKGGKGANVTVPFKKQAFEIADHCSDEARAAQAANTLLFNEDGTIFADNTDGRGFIRDLIHNHGYSLNQKKILLLGAGGAAWGLLTPLLRCNPREILIANRTPDKSIILANEFFSQKIPIRGIALNQIPLQPFDLIINSTSVGLGKEKLELPKELIQYQQSGCYDLVYGRPSAFLNWGEMLGAAFCLDGLGMLVEQAAISFFLWRGVYPETASVIKALRACRRSS